MNTQQLTKRTGVSLVACAAICLSLGATGSTAVAAPSAKPVASVSASSAKLASYPVFFKFTNGSGPRQVYLLVLRLNRDPLGLPPAVDGGRDYQKTRGTFTIGGATLDEPSDTYKISLGKKSPNTCVAVEILSTSGFKVAGVGDPKIGSRVKVTYTPINADRTYAPVITRQVTVREAKGRKGIKEPEVQKALSHIRCDYKQALAH